MALMYLLDILCAVSYQISVLGIYVFELLDFLRFLFVVDIDAHKQVLILGFLFNDLQRSGGIVFYILLHLRYNIFVLLLAGDVPILLLPK